jgi:DNA-binding CsgD family transcriptional regulator
MSKELSYLNIIEANLNEIVSPFSQKLSSEYFGFTPQELKIANLIKDGNQDKNISEILNISLETVKTHRQNIREKLNIRGKKTNLTTYLLSFTNK